MFRYKEDLYLHWGPYVGSTKLDNHILERLHEDGKKELESYHKKLAGHVKDKSSIMMKPQIGFINKYLIS